MSSVLLLLMSPQPGRADHGRDLTGRDVSHAGCGWLCCLPVAHSAYEGVSVKQYEAIRVVPVELREANAFVSLHHRHHKPTQGHRFSLGIVDDSDTLRGVCVVGRPVARLAGHPRRVLEVTRLATDGVRNGCSMLYAAAARTGKALGYERIQTYILSSEDGVSLRASGWESLGEAGGGQWKHTDGKPRRTDQPTEKKEKWSLRLNSTVPEVLNVPECSSGDAKATRPDLLLFTDLSE